MSYGYEIKVLTELFVVSMCMFTLPFVSFFGTQHLVKEYCHSCAGAGGLDIILPIVSAVLTVWLIISLYIVRAFRDEKNFVEDSEESKED